jgi:hypothetical protein
VEAAVALGLDRAGGGEQVDDELIGAVVAVVRPDRPQGHGQAWEVLCANHGRINEWVKDGLTVVKIGDLLARQGVLVPQRTLHRYCQERTNCQGRRRAGTVPVVDVSRGWNGVFAAHVRVVDLLPDSDRGDRRLRSSVCVLRRRLPSPHPGPLGVQRWRIATRGQYVTVTY